MNRARFQDLLDSRDDNIAGMAGERTALRPRVCSQETSKQRKRLRGRGISTVLSSLVLEPERFREGSKRLRG